MAVKRKTPRRRATAGIDVRGFTVVLEDLRAQFGVFGEALQGLREHMDARFERVDARLGGLEHEMGLVKVVLLEHGRQLADNTRQLTEHGRQLADNARQLTEHGRQLADNTRQLTEHGRQLADNTRQLTEHGRHLADHGRQLGEIRQTVQAIETKLDAKVDRGEVVLIVEAALSKRQ